MPDKEALNSPDLTRRSMLSLGWGGVAAAPVLLAGSGLGMPNAFAETPSPAANGVIDVREHGVRADGVTDDYEAIQRIFDEVLPPEGGVVQFPAGVCRCGGRVVSRKKPVILQGAGRGATRMLFTGNTENQVGFYFDQQHYPNTLQVRDISFVTDQQESGDALCVDYTPEDCMAMRVVQRVHLENINIVGVDIAQHGFRNGVILRHVNAPVLFNVCVSGRQPRAGMENRTHTESCIKLVAGAIHVSMPVEAALIKCSGYNARYGVNLIGAHEGLVVTAGNFVECAVGISQVCGPEEGLFPESEPLPDGGTRPGIWITDTHCNVFMAGVYLQDVVQGFINNCLIYKAPDAAQDCNGVHLSHCADIKVHHSMFVSHTREGRFDGIFAENNTSRCQFSNNTFTWTDYSIHLDEGASQIHAWENLSQGGSAGKQVDRGHGNRFRNLGENTWRNLNEDNAEPDQKQPKQADDE